LQQRKKRSILISDCPTAHNRSLLVRKLFLPEQTCTNFNIYVY
jgi:hypothetical protein